MIRFMYKVFLNTFELEKNLMLNAVLLANHDMVVFNSKLPVVTTEVKGRPCVVVAEGVNSSDYIVGVVKSSGLPVPQVGNVSATSVEMEVMGLGTISLSTSGGKEIHNLPAPVEGIVYITSSFTAASAASVGRTDVWAPAQLVCSINPDGTTTILGTIGFKQGG